MEPFIYTHEDSLAIWNQFVSKYSLNNAQQQSFKTYLDLILSENEKYNITAITSRKGVILDHFYDSLAILPLYDMSRVQTCVDIGSGAGLPGIPLAIMNPHMRVILIEVVQKKVHFLKLVIEALHLQNVSVFTEDWRTFLRSKTVSNVELFVARASLPISELTRIFKPSLSYGASTLAYWASQYWNAQEDKASYVHHCISYPVGDKMRSICFFKKDQPST